MAVLFLGALTFRASANPNETWAGNANGDWDTLSTGTGTSTVYNWIGGGVVNRVPTTIDNVYFTNQSSNMVVTFSQAAVDGSVNQPWDILFGGNGYGYTLGNPGDTNGLTFASGRPIFVLASLAGIGGAETINVPIEAQGNFTLGNFSPATSAGTAVNGTGGYDNTLVVNGNITGDVNSTFSFLGDGNITINGAIGSVGTTVVGLSEDIVGGGTLTLSGSNTFTGQSQFNGNVVLDYTTNNNNKISSTSQLYLGGNKNGGHVTVEGNNTAATVQSVSNFYAGSGANSVVVNGGTGATATLNLGAIATQSYGVVDFTNNSNGIITTTTGNAASINIIGQWATYDETYWATANGSGTVKTIGGLTSDNGDAFNSNLGNYTVDSGGQTLDAAALGATEGANTIRFAAGGALDLGGGSLSMTYGGILVAAGVTEDTSITDGTINVNAAHYGLDIYNYGTGTLTISASLDDVPVTKAGSGDVVLSGDNHAIYGQSINIDSGKLILGSATALGANTYVGAPTYGIGNILNFGDGTSTLDMNGFSAIVTGLNSDVNMIPGNQAAAAGLNSQIVNSAAGTLSTMEIVGNSNITPANGASTITLQVVNLGTYYGGLNEASGAILALDIEQGAATGQVQFNLGTANPFGDPTGANGTNASGLTGANDVFTGAVTVGVGANLGIVGYSNIETLGVFDMEGNFGAAGNQNSAFATTYWMGSGTVLTDYNVGTALWVDTIGSADDTFKGYFGTGITTTGTISSNGIPIISLNVDGTGSLVLTNPLYGAGVNTYGTSQLTMPGFATNNNFTISGESTVTLTGTSGNIGGGNTYLYGGRLIIAPSGSGGDIVVDSQGTTLSFNDNGAIVLDSGSNTSLTYEMGSATTSSFSFAGSSQDASFILGSAQGLAALGTTDKLVLLTNANKSPVTLIDGIVLPAATHNTSVAYAQDDAVGSSLDATFLTYVGTGLATDPGFEAYQFTNIDNLAALSSTSFATTSKNLALVNDTETLTGYDTLYGLQIDSGGVVNVGTFGLGIGNVDSGSGYVILNGGSSINGTLKLFSNAHVYTDLDNGTITDIDIGSGHEFAKDGPGTLFTTFSDSANNRIIVNGGALDVGDLGGFNGNVIYLHGGVIQGSGAFSRTLVDSAASNGVVFTDNTSNDYNESLGGGFSARGGALTVTLTDGTGSTNLVWGVTSEFLQEGSVFNFGSTTSDNVVFFTNNLDLGPSINDTALYSRVIDVTANSADVGADPYTYADLTIMEGVISSDSNPYAGLSKTGDGVLDLAGANTYTGATTIDQGTLAISSDNNLGTAPTAAYALNTSPGISGAALTPGAVEINGGAALEAVADMVLSSDRQILLASGTTGATPSIIDVLGDSVYGYAELDFGGIMADYVGEVGSLQKQGGGLFNYSGTAYNTGTDSVAEGTFEVSGAGNINSVAGVEINNTSYTDATTNSQAKFNYAGTAVGLNRTVTFGANGGTFAYNSSQAYSGATTMTFGAKQTLSGGINGNGNLSATAITIASGGTLLPGDIDMTKGSAIGTIGTLTTGAVTLLGGGNYNFLISDVLGAAGTGYSTVLASSVDLLGLSSTMTFDINLETLALDGTPGAPTNFDPTQNYSFTLFSTGAGGITQLTQAELDADFAIFVNANNGATGFDPAPGSWEVTEAADGSSLTLDYTGTAAPEPSTWAMLFAGLGLLVVIRRFRRQSSSI